MYTTSGGEGGGRFYKIRVPCNPRRVIHTMHPDFLSGAYTFGPETQRNRMRIPGRICIGTDQAVDGKGQFPICLLAIDKRLGGMFVRRRFLAKYFSRPYVLMLVIDLLWCRELAEPSPCSITEQLNAKSLKEV